MSTPVNDSACPPSLADLNIPSEHVPLLLNSIVNEGLLDFKRELVNGQWVWTGNGMDGKPTNELFDLVHNDYLAMDLLIRFCDGQPLPLGFQANRIPMIKGVNERAQWSLYVMQPDKGGQPQTIAHVNAYRLGVAIATALCHILEADLQVQHRTLFPAHYLAIAN